MRLVSLSAIAQLNIFSSDNKTNRPSCTDAPQPSHSTTSLSLSAKHNTVHSRHTPPPHCHCQPNTTQFTHVTLHHLTVTVYQTQHSSPTSHSATSPSLSTKHHTVHSRHTPPPHCHCLPNTTQFTHVTVRHLNVTVNQTPHSSHQSLASTLITGCAIAHDQQSQ